MKVLITGGNGFIGSHLAEALISTGHNVILLDIKFTKNVEGLECEKIILDVTELSSFNLLPKDVDLVFHLAAVSRVELGEKDPQNCLKVNVIGTLNVLKWSSGLSFKPYVVFSSSRDVYGEPIYIPVDELHPKSPISVYGIGKSACEELLQHFKRSLQLRYTTVRLSNVYGSLRDLPERVIPTFVRKALRNETIQVYGADKVIDFVFINDVTAALLSLVKRVEKDNESLNGLCINICSGSGVSLLELANNIKDICNSHSPIIVAESQKYEVRRYIGSYKRAKELLGYEPATTLDKGLRSYIDSLSR